MFRALILIDNNFFQAWISQGIRIHGILLIYEGSAFCSTCIDDPAEYHGARYKYHLSPGFPHFEVRIHNDFNLTKYFNDLNVSSVFSLEIIHFDHYNALFQLARTSSISCGTLVYIHTH